MRIFTRYILKEVLSHGVIGASVFTFVIFMRDMAQLLELIVRGSAPVPSVAEPSLNVTLPVAADGVTVAVKITLWPGADGLTEDLKVMEVVG